MGNGVLFVVMDIAAFRPVEEYAATSATVAARVKNVQPAPGFGEVMLPGEPEQRMAAARRAQGIAVDDTTWNLLREDAAALGVTLPLT
jgi:uncharacterized oxidoreductase